MKKYAVIGNPVSQSWSPFIHQQFAKQTCIDLSYEALAINCSTLLHFKQTLMQLCDAGYHGVNVTLPYKLFAFAALQKKHELSAYAEKSGAVNMITFMDQSQWLGDNTDGIGLIRDLKNNLSWSLQDINILILGAGGAARGAIFALIQEKPTCIHILNRDPAKAENLANDFTHYSIQMKSISIPLQDARLSNGSCRLQAPYAPNRSHKGLSSATRSAFRSRILKSERYIPHHLIINATSASLWQQLPTTISHLNAKNAYCYDMVYGPTPTVFLTWAKERQAKNSSDGLGMLVEQAAASFYQWHHVMPDTLPVIQSLRHRL